MSTGVGVGISGRKGVVAMGTITLAGGVVSVGVEVGGSGVIRGRGATRGTRFGFGVGVVVARAGR